MVATNNSINNTVGDTNSGVTNLFTVQNLSNTASSGARQTIKVAGTSAGNPTLNFNNSSTQWELGLDNSASGDWKISQNNALGTNDTFITTPSGQITMPRTPAFFAYLGTTVNNVTGDGTSYNPIFNIVGFDQNSNYNSSTGVFTAPIAGKYYLQTTINITNINPAHNSFLVGLIISGNEYRFSECNAANARSTTSSAGFSGSMILSLSASQTVQVAVEVQSSTKTINIRGKDATSFILNFFSAQLMC